MRSNGHTLSGFGLLPMIPHRRDVLQVLLLAKILAEDPIPLYAEAFVLQVVDDVCEIGSRAFPRVGNLLEHMGVCEEKIGEAIQLRGFYIAERLLLDFHPEPAVLVAVHVEVLWQPDSTSTAL